MIKALKPAYKGCTGSLMAEMEQKPPLLKQAATLDIASPDTCHYQIPPFDPFTST